ncbi:MAG: site-2 protease family protein [Proteobacteria bacterium]|nr:site-2 protease family protein [Pseudomonadota bacterium]MBU1610778.1 site-2 protease family protein [Pseudomonadota bacterium]
MFDALFNDPIGYLLDIALLAIPFLYGVIFHELAHGWVALKLGDPTARLAGRLTLNPIKHLDPLGTVMFFLVHIGWAKPVPVNPGYFKNPSQGMIWVSLAGPIANFLQAAVYALIYHLIIGQRVPNISILPTVVYLLRDVALFGVFVNLILGFFNLIPIPPMDGSNILAGLLPARLARPYMSLARYGMVLVILLAVFGVLSQILIPCTRFGMELLGLPRII